MMSYETWSQPYTDGADRDADALRVYEEPPEEPDAGPVTLQTEQEPGRATHRQALSLADLIRNLGRAANRPFIAERRVPDPDKPGNVDRGVTNSMPVKGNTVPSFRGTDTHIGPSHDVLPDGDEVAGQGLPLVVVDTRETPAQRLFMVRILVSATGPVQVLGLDHARRAAMIRNEDAADSVWIATRPEHCQASGTTVFLLPPGQTFSTSTRSELWAIASPTPCFISVATEVG